MSGFSPGWLALREPVDHRSRDRALAERLGRHVAGRRVVRVVDIGCGTGSNLRAASALLGPVQAWMLVDYDARLLAASREALSAWADTAEVRGDELALTKDGRRLDVRFRPCDLDRDLDGALADDADLVTASAFFDLCSEAFIARLVRAVACRRAAFHTVLTYDGVQSWEPAHEADGDMLDAFRAHQLTDKGLGPSAGWRAPEVLARGFRTAGYEVHEAWSPWRLGEADRTLIGELARGFADAIAETGRVAGSRLAAWRAVTRTQAIVGHVDTLALPGRRSID
jgi:SAM-dependent methyltransferase